MTNRVHFEDLEYDGDQLFLNGKSFNGIAYELYENGQLHSESEYFDGWEVNVSKEWYDNGTLKSIQAYKRGQGHGQGQDFFENGAKKSETNFELGVLLEQKKWSEQGKLLEHWILDRERDNIQYECLLQRRRLERELPID